MIIEIVPFKTFKEKLRIVKELQKKSMYIEIWDNMIYAATRYRKVDED